MQISIGLDFMKKTDKGQRAISEEHPDWKAFDNQAHNGVIFTNFAYTETDEDMAKMAEQIPLGYEMFLMTDHVSDSKEASFRCVAFLNQDTKEIVFATAGTRPSLDQKGFDDLYDDGLQTSKNESCSDFK